VITLTPNEMNTDMDLDLVMYRERFPFTMVFPNMFARNHPYNTEENALIRQAHSYWEEGLYIVKVVADDSLFRNNFYHIAATNNCMLLIVK